VKEPGPDHPITLTPATGQVRVRIQDHVIGASDRALVLKEADYPPVFYIPREDVESAFLSKTAHTSHCPYKGDASYYSLFINGALVENAAWSYEQPYPAMEAIRGMLAFYTDKLDVYEVDQADIDDHRRPEASQTWPEPNTGA
jgi:uncharacterized protein (DUF427 family)